MLGLDGGGTKSDCVLMDTEGNLVDYLQWGTTSHEFLDGGMKELEIELKKMFSELFARNHIDSGQIEHAVFGMAGVDTHYQQEKIKNMIAQNGIAHFRVCNDGYLGIKAGTTNGVGITAINGTGCSFTGINRTGDMMQVGGQAVVMDDIGGGYIIGRNIVRLVHRDLILGGKSTVMSQMLMERIGADTSEALMDELVYQVGENVIQIKHLAYIIFEAAKLGDEVAKAYLSDMGRQIAEYICAIVTKLGMADQQQIEVVLIGSVFLQAVDHTHIDSMEKETTKELGAEKIIFRPLTSRPVCGAVLWALEDLGMCKGQEERIKVIKEIERHIVI